MNKIYQQITVFKILFFIIFLAMFSQFVWNVWYYNPYWGYDGGAHIEYIFTLAEQNKMPDMEQNYLAWHEPFFYFINAGLVKFALWLGMSKVVILKVLQFFCLMFGVVLAIGGFFLVFILTRRRWLALTTFGFMAFLPELSEASRLISNELFFQASLIWWLVLFFYWQMNNEKKWSKKKWSILIGGLVFMLWVKLTAWILVIAVVLWLLFKAWENKNKSTLWLAGLLVLVCVVAYTPWLAYKQINFGEALTINNYEEIKDKRMPSTFYITWDNGVMINPFYKAGIKSFWSMLYADTLGDYYNIFQNYESDNNWLGIKTPNDRLVSQSYYSQALFLRWWSAPLFVFLSIGFLSAIFILIKNKFKSDYLLILIIALGMLFGLIYNTYHYPFLTRGTMKAIFALAFFPLFYFIGARQLWEFVQNFKYKKTVQLIGTVYILSFFLFSWLVNWL